MGSAGAPDRNRTSADSSLATYSFGTCTTLMETGSRPAAARSATAAWADEGPPCRATMTSRAPTASAASTAPSSTRCGRMRIRSASLCEAGSPSAALTTTTGRRRPATARILRAVGKPAPPWPVRPARSTASINIMGAPSPPKPCKRRPPCRSRCSARGIGRAGTGPPTMSRGSPCGASSAGRGAAGTVGVTVGYLWFPRDRPWRIPGRWPWRR